MHLSALEKAVLSRVFQISNLHDLFYGNMFYSKGLKKVSEGYRITSRDLVNLIIISGNQRKEIGICQILLK